MSRATRCAACGTVFRVVVDQLRVADGWVRCGQCAEVFNAIEGLVDLDADGTPAPSPDRQHLLDDLAPRPRAGGADAAAAPAVPAPPSATAGSAGDAPGPAAAAPEDAPPRADAGTNADADADASADTTAASFATDARAFDVAFDFDVGPADAATAVPWAAAIDPAGSPPAAPASTPSTAVTMDAVAAPESPASGPESATPAEDAGLQAGRDLEAVVRPDDGSDPDDVRAADVHPDDLAAGLHPAGADLASAAADAGAPVVGTAATAGSDVPPALASTTAAAQPAFVRRAQRAERWQRAPLRALLALGCLAAALLLGLQAAWAWRDTLAARWPATRPALERLCALADCRIEPLRRIAAFSVDSSELTRIDGTALMRLAVVLRNRGAQALRLPAFDLVLNDEQGRMVARRVLQPAELGATRDTLDAGGELALNATLGTGGRAVAGYTIEIFYP